ncbi:phosphoribosyltransferase [Sinomicrobium weinanense]|uniref:Phosphoribosyltransferase n=1 Tax=Sinomicrobium weinanense TaxID=2842200 RepID=A0A926JQT7_9FLAO|nr:phosphoribosyltransferase family protein [Sinomicrobium weinanense]MBC9795795.1 phosphoribosyltransferase [Sinomicrobium weinanense]MBU3121839.1 phosphoribosyltransferase [Sinomicrobium weinanense]
MFRDRIQAAIELTELLKPYQGQNAIILAIPRRGLPLGVVIARTLKLPLDVVLTKKISHPHNREYAIGAVSLSSVVLDDTVKKIPGSYIEGEVNSIRKILSERYRLYYPDHNPMSVRDRTAIVVDDGIATGNTMLATAELLFKEKTKKIIVAVPVASPQAIQKLEKSPYINKIICLEQPVNFYAVGAHYEVFDQVTDEEAVKLLKMANRTENV